MSQRLDVCGFESRGHRDALRIYTVKRIPAVPSGVRFVDYSTLCAFYELGEVASSFTVVV